MVAKTRIRVLGLTLVLALLLVACGQKPGVHVEGGPLASGPSGGTPTVDDGMGGDAGGVATGGDEFAADDLDLDAGASVGDTGDAADGPSTADGSSGEDTAATGGSDPQATGSGDGGDDGGAAQQGTREPQGSDRTGVTDDTITLAIHAPVTGPHRCRRPPSRPPATSTGSGSPRSRARRCWGAATSR